MQSAVILATGSPAHETQLTHTRPRAMLPALGKPMVVRVMERLYRTGIRHFIVLVGVNEGGVASYLNAHWVPDANVSYHLKTENESLSDALSQIARRLGAPFLLSSYNSFTYAQFFENLLKNHGEAPEDLVLAGAPSTLSASREHYYALAEGTTIYAIDRQPPKQIDGQGRTFILTDLAICGQRFVDYLAGQDPSAPQAFTHQFLDVARRYVIQAEQATLDETSWILQVESDLDLLRLNEHLLTEPTDAHILTEIPRSVKVVPPVRVDPRVSIGHDAVIGPYVYLEKGCSIGSGAQVKNAIVLENAAVPRNARVHDAVISTRALIQR